MVVKSKSVLAIIQARVSSSRLPGKVLKMIANKTIIEHVYNRVSFSEKNKKYCCGN